MNLGSNFPFLNKFLFILVVMLYGLGNVSIYLSSINIPLKCYGGIFFKIGIINQLILFLLLLKILYIKLSNLSRIFTVVIVLRKTFSSKK